MPVAEINQAIEAFDRRHQPWEFRPSVLKLLSTEDQAQFETILREALDDKYWQSSNLAECANLAETAVQARFPSLTRAACRAIARAAAYKWR